MWNLKILYDSDEKWIKYYEEYAKEMAVLETPKIELNKLEEIFNFIQCNAIILDDIYTYGLLRREQDVLNKDVTKGLSQIRQIYVDFNKKLELLLSFFRERRKEILDILHVDPKLKKYYSYFLNMNLNSQNEIKEIYNKIAPYDRYMEWYGSFERIGEDPRTHQEINEFNLLNYLKSERKEERRLVYHAVEEFLKENSEIAAGYLNTHIQLNNYAASKCGFDDSYSYFTANNTLCKNAKEFLIHYKSIFVDINKKIVEVKKSMLCLDTIGYEDMYFLSGELEYNISIDEAKQIVLESFSKFGTEFQQITKKALYENWIDSENYDGKHSGQRSYSSYRSHPYITIPWNGRIDDLFSLAHEVAGAVGQWFAAENQEYIYSELSIVKVEFLSALGMLYLSEYLLENRNFNKIEKLVKAKVIDFLKDSLMVPFEFSLIEMELYSKGVKQKLIVDDISDIWYSVIENFHDVSNFEEMRINRYNWVRHDHLYLNAYDFRYIESFLIALSSSEKVTRKNDKFIKLLRLGEKVTDKIFFDEIEGKRESRFLVNEAIKKVYNLLEECEK